MDTEPFSSVALLLSSWRDAAVLWDRLAQTERDMEEWPHLAGSRHSVTLPAMAETSQKRGFKRS
jgi:hypothetical protein